MPFVWRWDSLLGLVASALALSLAAIILRTGPTRTANRRLALVLAFEGIAIGLGNGADVLGVGDAASFAWIASGTQCSYDLMAVAYLRFLGILDTPLSRRLNGRTAGVVLGGIGVLLILALAVGGPPNFVPYVVPGPDGTWIWPDFAFNIGNIVYPLTVLAPVLGLGVALLAYRRAPPGSAPRRRARAYATAFGARDAMFFAILGTAMTLSDFDPRAQYLWKLGLPLTTIVGSSLIAWALLREQLFDIDLRHVGVERGTVVAVFVAVFLGAGLGVGRALTGSFSFAAGGLGVAILLLAVVPVHRFAEHLADRVAPRGTRRALGARRVDAYRAALEGALADGCDPAADAVLARLRSSLGITPDEHRAALASAAQSRTVSARPPRGFRIERELGRGGSGRAVLAREAATDRLVVLKQPLGLWAPGDARRDRVLREARIAGRLRHPNIVAVERVLADEDPPVLVLEYVEGESLVERLARGPLTEAEATRLATDVLRGLACIHAAGIVHRDIKPGNILLGRDGTARITDFGVAHDPAELASATATGFQPGSPAYMSPEQRRGEAVDPRSDLYSLGVVLREAMAAPGATQAYAGHATPGPSEALGKALRRALADAAADRFPDAAAMAEALRPAAVA